jgi:hypothetical protein
VSGLHRQSKADAIQEATKGLRAAIVAFDSGEIDGTGLSHAVKQFPLVEAEAAARENEMLRKSYTEICKASALQREVRCSVTQIVEREDGTSSVIYLAPTLSAEKEDAEAEAIRKMVGVVLARWTAESQMLAYASSQIFAVSADVIEDMKSPEPERPFFDGEITELIEALRDGSLIKIMQSSLVSRWGKSSEDPVR